MRPVTGLDGVDGARAGGDEIDRRGRRPPRPCTPAAVVVVNVTGRPDDAMAATTTGVWASVFAVGPVNVIVWASKVTLKLRLTEGAVANAALPG